MLKRKKKTAFTMIEMLCAIFLITIGAAGVFSLVSQTISFTNTSSSKLVALYLAQEGIEIVRNIRDSNWLEARTNPEILWDDGLPQGDWEADYRTTALTQSYIGRYLNIDTNGLYSYSSGTQTKFQRKITISDKANLDGDIEEIPDIMKVSVKVSWQERGRTYQVTVLENLYRWYY